MSRGDQTEVILPDEKLTRLIYLLDEDGPIRYRDVSFHPDGLGNYFAYLLMKKEFGLLDSLSSAIDFGFIEGWITGQENQDLYKPINLGWNPKKIKTFIRKNEMGFGLERCLYELNPYLACLSPVLDSVYAVSLPAVLAALNQGKLNGKNIDEDKHLTAYICVKTGIEDSIKVKPLQNYPFFNKSMAIKLCAMFALAQTKASIEKLPGLANWTRQNLSQVSDRLYSVNIRKLYIEGLDKAVLTGDLDKLFSAASSAKLIKKDVYGFQEAKKTFKILNFEILKLKSQHNLDQLAYRLGLRIAVIVSYLICSVAMLTVVLMNY
jgi:hypothetical protein